MPLFDKIMNWLVQPVAKPKTPAKAATPAPALSFNTASFMANYAVQEKAKFVIALEEGRSNKVYRDSHGYRTIGVGFNMDAAGASKQWTAAGVRTGFTTALNGRAAITEGEVDSLFAVSFASAEKGAKSIYSGYGKLGEWQRVALVSMVFQMGSAGVAKFTGTLGALASGNKGLVYSRILDSAWAKQTPARAKRTAMMLAYNISHSAAEEHLAQTGQISARERKYA